METAAEAYKDTMKIRQEAAEKEISLIEQKVKQAKQRGEFQITIDKVSADVSEHLKFLGYKVDQQNDRNEDYVTINWNKANFKG